MHRDKTRKITVSGLPARDSMRRAGGARSLVGLPTRASKTAALRGSDGEHADAELHASDGSTTTSDHGFRALAKADAGDQRPAPTP